ncbi:MAG TPA: cupin domain-containing protein [Steroidobacteraceae bacterium]|nr:cupin domain-containing protein [Steroidobacteraceae bacterium]
MQRNVSGTQASAATLIAHLQLEPHPEGGWYREVHRSATLLETARGPRAALTSIYFLLEQQQHSRWHVVTSDEVWHFTCGAPLELLSYEPRSRVFQRRMLGLPQEGQEPSLVVNAGEWQAARSTGEWSLVSCDVAPGFDFEDFSFVAALVGHEAAFTGDLAPHTNLL